MHNTKQKQRFGKEFRVEVGLAGLCWKEKEESNQWTQRKSFKKKHLSSKSFKSSNAYFNKKGKNITAMLWASKRLDDIGKCNKKEKHMYK